MATTFRSDPTASDTSAIGTLVGVLALLAIVAIVYFAVVGRRVGLGGSSVMDNGNPVEDSREAPVPPQPR